MVIPKEVHTAFSDSIEFGKTDDVESLLQQYPDLVNHDDWTPPPLHCAVLWNQPAIAEILLDHGADIEKQDKDRSTTALRYAIVYCKEEMIRLLLSRGGNAGPIVENGTTALALAESGVAGAFDDFDDLPRKDEYTKVVELLSELGVHS